MWQLKIKSWIMKKNKRSRAICGFEQFFSWFDLSNQRHAEWVSSFLLVLAISLYTRTELNAKQCTMQMTVTQETNAWQEITGFDEPIALNESDAPVSLLFLKGRFVCRYTIWMQSIRTYPLGTAYFATMRLTQKRKRFETIDRAKRQIRTRENFNRNLVFLHPHDDSYFFFLLFFWECPRILNFNIQRGEKKATFFVPWIKID